MAGRPRKPTALKVLEGNRGHRPLNLDAEPQPPKGVLRTPAGMSKECKRLWRSLSAALDELNLLTVVDATALEAACRGAAMAKAADAEIEKIQEKMSAGDAGHEDFHRINVLNNVSKKGWQQYKTFATEFGLTPASRSRINVDPGQKPNSPAKRNDPIEGALCGGRRLQA